MPKFLRTFGGLAVCMLALGLGFYINNTASADLGDAWLQGGNSNVTSEQTLGPTTAFGLPFITNGTERGRFTTAGNFGLGTAAPSGQLHVVSTDATTKTIVVQGASSQSANLTEWQNSSGTVLSNVLPSGAFVAPDGAASLPGLRFRGSTNSGFYLPSTLNGVGITYAGTLTAVIGQLTSVTGIALRSDGQLLFGTTAPLTSNTTDTGIARDSAGVIRISNGSSGRGSLVAASGDFSSTSPFPLTTTNTTGAAVLTVQSYRNSPWTHAQFYGKAARGTAAEPAGLLAGDHMAYFMASGLDSGLGNGNGDDAQITMAAAEDLTPTAHGSNIMFDTTPIGTIHRVERLRISSEGFVGVNNPAPQSTLHVGITNSASNQYLQIDSEPGTPPASDCNSDTQRGRMIHDFSSNKIYVCGGAVRGWDHLDLAD